jgi:hypothetical protein
MLHKRTMTLTQHWKSANKMNLQEEPPSPNTEVRNVQDWESVCNCRYFRNQPHHGAGNILRVHKWLWFADPRCEALRENGEFLFFLRSPDSSESLSLIFRWDEKLVSLCKHSVISEVHSCHLKEKWEVHVVEPCLLWNPQLREQWHFHELLLQLEVLSYSVTHTTGALNCKLVLVPCL